MFVLLVSVAIAVLVLAVAVLLAITVAGRIAARRFKVGQRARVPTLTVVAVSEETVTLTRTPQTSHPGRFGLSWPEGAAPVGDLVSPGRQTVTRRLIHARPRPARGAAVRWDSFVFRGDPGTAHGLPFDDVMIPGPLGSMPAWRLPGERTTWVLLIHGNRVTREESLRILPAVSSAGFPALVPTYRNDKGAPSSPDGLYRLGDSEWEDLEAAVAYAVGMGAEDVVLYGWSMGGSIVEAFLDRSARADRVRAVVLDAPLLNPYAVMDVEIRRRRVGWLAGMLKWQVAKRTGINFAALDHENRDGRRPIPTLLFHGTDDGVVPVASSDAFARRHSELVTYHRVPDAGHTLAWNIDPACYEEALTQFLGRIIEPAVPSEASTVD